jgi:hypothetical protein
MVDLSKPRKVTFDKEHHYEFSRNKFNIVKTKTISLRQYKDDIENISCDIFYYLTSFFC